MALRPVRVLGAAAERRLLRSGRRPFRPLTVTYNLKSAGADSTGRDQTYVLPALPMRILSLVPKAAGDIRDASSMTFADIESRRYSAHRGARRRVGSRSSFAAVFAVLALVLRVRAALPRDARRPRRKPVPAVVGAGRRAPTALRDVQRDASRGRVVAGAGAPGAAGAAHRRRRRRWAGPSRSSTVAADATSARGTGRRADAAGSAAARAVLSAATTPRAIASALDDRDDLGGARRARRDDAARRRAAGVWQRRLRPPDGGSRRSTAPSSIARSRQAHRRRAAAARRARRGRCAWCRALTRGLTWGVGCTVPDIRAAADRASAPPWTSGARTRWEDLRFTDARGALLVCAALLAIVLLVLLVRAMPAAAGRAARTSRCRRCCRSCAVSHLSALRATCRCCSSAPACRSSRWRWPIRTPGSRARRCRIRAAGSRCSSTRRPAW